MRAIYPTPATWAAFERAVEEKVTADMLDEKTSVIVARSRAETKQEDEGEVVGFAVWCHASVTREEENESTSGDAEAYMAPQWNLPEGTDWSILTAWREAAAKIAEMVVGERRHYGECTTPLSILLILVPNLMIQQPNHWQCCSPTELSWIAVSPDHSRQGVGTMLLRWGLDACDKQHAPAYLESTVEAAEAFYAKVGFREKGRIQLVVKGELYEEVACLYEPTM